MFNLLNLLDFSLQLLKIIHVSTLEVVDPTFQQSPVLEATGLCALEFVR